jgi:hypothetical protein
MNPRTLRPLIPCLLLFLGVAACAQSITPVPSLTSVGQIRRLSLQRGERGRQVLLEGVVTFYEPAEHMLFVADSTGDIFVRTPGIFPVHKGDLVQVRGIPIGGFHETIEIALHVEQAADHSSSGNPEGISKECGKSGKPASRLSMLSILCHFHGLLWKRVQNHNHRENPFWEREHPSVLRTADYSASALRSTLDDRIGDFQGQGRQELPVGPLVRRGLRGYL